MKYTVYQLGNLSRGNIVEVTLKGNAANVLLLDSGNYNNYKNGRRYRYYGGYVKSSPYRVIVPNDGRWFVVINLGGYSGQVRSSVRVLPGAMPPAKRYNASDLSSLFLGNKLDNDSEKEYDVFISHASEDKDEVVRPLANALRGRKLNVWYDEFELKIGDSLRQKIDKGVANSKFGIVILSKNFIKKGWTNYELDGLITRSISNQQILLPIWHNITKQEVIDYSPSIADKVARSTSVNTIEEIAAEIAEIIKGKEDENV